MIRLAVGIFFIALPFVELVLLIKLVYSLGFFTTLGMMVLAGVVGAAVIAQQSAGAFRQALEAAARGETPHTAVLDGMFLMLAGVFLVIPGLITDAMGLALLVPPVRQWVARKTFDSVLRNSAFEDAAEPKPRPGNDPFEGRRQSPPGNGPIIEGEFERLDERAPGGSSGGPRKDPPRT